jgi:hypothetical protein
MSIVEPHASASADRSTAVTVGAP